VLTAHGPILASDIVLAAGLWSRPLARQLGTNVPMQAERGYGIDLPNPGVELEHPLLFAEEHVGLTRFRSGLRLTGIDELASVGTPADMRLPERLIRAAKRAMPELNTEGGRTWMRMRPSTPDSLPVIGRAPQVENAYFAFGHGHKGLGTGAITAKLVQEVMDGHPTTIDLAPYDPARFALLRRS
jgi:D-amino-acid dehydrogenase